MAQAKAGPNGGARKEGGTGPNGKQEPKQMQKASKEEQQKFMAVWMARNPEEVKRILAAQEVASQVVVVAELQTEQALQVVDAGVQEVMPQVAVELTAKRVKSAKAAVEQEDANIC